MTGTAILLVEDEFLIAAMIEEPLVEGGFEVVPVGNGAKALAELDVDASRFRALVTDIRLGKGPDGWEIARRARELVPGIPVVYVSGDSAPDWTSKGVPDSVMVVKPFAAAQIVTALATLITDAERHALVERGGPSPPDGQ